MQAPLPPILLRMHLRLLTPSPFSSLSPAEDVAYAGLSTAMADNNYRPVAKLFLDAWKVRLLSATAACAHTHSHAAAPHLRAPRRSVSLPPAQLTHKTPQTPHLPQTPARPDALRAPRCGKPGCALSPLSSLLSHLFSLLSPVFSLLSPVFCLLSPVSCLLSPVSCLLLAASLLPLAGACCLCTCVCCFLCVCCACAVCADVGYRWARQLAPANADLREGLNFVQKQLKQKRCALHRNATLPTW